MSDRRRFWSASLRDSASCPFVSTSLALAAVEATRGGPEQAEPARAGQQVVERGAAVPAAAEVGLVEEARGEGAVPLAEDETGQEHLEPPAVGFRVGEEGGDLAFRVTAEG